MREVGLFHLISIAIWLLLCFGLIFRHRRKFHVRAMATACIADVLLVVWIEVERMAVEKALALGSNPPPGPLLGFHIVISVLVLVGYGAQIALGRRLLRGDGQVRRLHRRIGFTFMTLRTTNLVTSFLI